MYTSWILLVITTVWVSLLAFFWALANGQFSDQNRARYLPLSDDFQPPVKEHRPWKGRERYVFLFIGAACLCIFGTAILLSLGAFRG